jgi:hypothetical protein
MSPRAPRRAARRGYETEVIVCARREAGLEVARDGRIVAAAPVAMPLTRRLDAAGLQLRPLAPASPVRRESIRRAPAAERALASLASCFLVTAAGGAPPPTPEQARELAADLSASDAVETAYVKPPVALPVQPGEAPAPQRADGRPAVTPSLRARQGYLDPAPRGIGAEAAWARPGGLGEGVRVVDIEMAWRFSHEDLRNRPNRLLSGRQPGQRDSRNHGTNVLGMLAADHNGRGVMGICPAADVRCISIGTDEWTSSAAVREAADVLGPGDIILVELERSPGTEDDPAGYLPIEWWPDDLDAIRYATGKGVIVVEAAGNSGLDIGTSGRRDATGFPADWSDPLAGPDAPSGAVIVGAGEPPPRPHGDDAGGPGVLDRSRVGFSNHGERVDAQGWGAAVTTTGGFGDERGDPALSGEDEDRWYTDRFNGTSSAAPMVAGALACAQGILRAADVRPLTPAEAREALRATGSPQQHGPPGRVGSRPAVDEIVRWVTETRSPRPPRPRRRGMKVTITIEDAPGEDTVTVPSPLDGGDDTVTRPPAVVGLPYVKGPNVLSVPTESGEVDVEMDEELARRVAELVERAKGGGPEQGATSSS